MGNENKKTQSMVTSNSRNNSPRGSETFSQTPTSVTPAPTTPNQPLPMSHSFDQLPFLSPSPAIPPAPLTTGFAGSTFLPSSSTFNPLTLPNSGFLTTPITSGLSLPFTFPPIKLPPAPQLYRFNKYDGLFDDYEYGLARYRPRHYCCPNYCLRDCHCPQVVNAPAPRPHSTNHHRSHHSTTTSNHHSSSTSSHHNDKRHERRSVDHHTSKHHHHNHHTQSTTQQPVRVICRNA